MIISYGANNFFCFKDGVEVSFEFPSKCPVEISRGRHLTNTMCVKGGNASGKTNVLKVMAFLAYFTTKSWSDDPDEELQYASYFYSDTPSEFYVEFIVDKVIYRYELECTQTKVIREAIYRKVSRDKLIIERLGNEITFRTSEFSNLSNMKLRSNSSLISSARQYGFEETSPIYEKMITCISNIKYHGRSDTYITDLNIQSKYYHDSKAKAEFVSEFISRVDPSIKSFTIHESPDQDKKVSYFPIFEHYTSNGKTHFLPYSLQSNGIKALYMELIRYIYVLDTGGLLAMDEFDTHLHPDLLPLLINLFENKENNPNNAQLIFTAHNSEVLNSMSKYQTILVNKEFSESYAYRIDELPENAVRVDRSLRNTYESGKIGGRPKL